MKIEKGFGKAKAIATKGYNRMLISNLNFHRRAAEKLYEFKSKNGSSLLTCLPVGRLGSIGLSLLTCLPVGRLGPSCMQSSDCFKKKKTADQNPKALLD